MKFQVYTNRKANGTGHAGGSMGKSVIIEPATAFYAQLERACTERTDIHLRYEMLRSVFKRVVEQSIRDSRIAFSGLFAKLDYCIKEFRVPYRVASLIHQSRKDLFSEHNKNGTLTASDLARLFPHNLKAVTLLVYHLCGMEKIPACLEAHFPIADRERTWGAFDERAVRAIVERWDDRYIWATEEVNGTTLKISYGTENKILTRDGSFSWDYLSQVLWTGAQLGLVRIRKDERGEVCLPELIILEPDYLVNVTTIANCFESYAESPFVNLVNKLKPRPNSLSIHMGNLAGMLLSDEVCGGGDFEKTFASFISANMPDLLSCSGASPDLLQFKEEAKLQKRNISQLVGQNLPQAVAGYDSRQVMFEPSFFSEVLGLQGRFDFLFEKEDRKGICSEATIIEQKSGKGAFPPGKDPGTPKPREPHMVQALLYRALYQYDFNLYAMQLSHVMLLYSKYPNGLIGMSPNTGLLLRAVKMRNLIAWTEVLYAKEGLDFIKTLTPEKLNKKGVGDRLWETYTRPQLERLLEPVRKASELELAYYLRFMRFIENEQLLAKVGNRVKDNSGFASTWHDTLDEKKAAGNIYDMLTIADYGHASEGGRVNAVTLDFGDKGAAEAANFRIGDIVILYPYKKGDVPNACAQMVFRGCIEDIREHCVKLRLRDSQAGPRVFERFKDTWWAVEHDMYESSTNSLYSAMHSFLSAPQRRRDLVLMQREPAVDTSRTLKGDYGPFSTLVTRAKQARDLFLVIGPPGTGKTSYGLVNLLKEELSEENTSVLLLSFTNRAVDEICSKLVEMTVQDPTFDFIRIGSELSCSKEYRSHLLSTRTQACGSSETRELIQRTRVFCGTTAALNGNLSLFSVKQFSLAIVDEASQILEPHLAALLSAHDKGAEAIGRFVLIGDHKQLPAIVMQTQDESAVAEPILRSIHLTDCRDSLFERLLRQFKTGSGYDARFVYTLTKQGRMHRDIAEFASHTFYGNRLGIVPLEHQQLPAPEVRSGNGIARMLASHRIAFVASETPQGTLSDKTNEVEARMIAATVCQIYHLTSQNFDKDRTVGVIVPYRNQISAVRNAIDTFGISLLHNITIDTVERYQGSQRDYIIYGFTVQHTYQLNFLTNNVFEEDGILIDRKLNVAMTRARLNLVLIGNPSLLNKNFMFRKLMTFVSSKGGYVDVPCDAYCRGDFKMARQNV